MKYCPECKNELEMEILDGKPRMVCKKCGFVFWNNPVPVVAAIVPYNKGIVIVKSSIRKTWGLPAGHIEYGDTAEERVIQEVKEETGLDAKIEKFLGTWKTKNLNVLILVYSMEVLGGFLRPGGDVEEVKVVSINEALEVLKNKAGGLALRKWAIEKNILTTKTC